MRTWIRFFIGTVLAFSVVPMVSAEEIRQPMPAPPVSPTIATAPPCVETRFWRIILNNHWYPWGFVESTYYYEVRWDIDGKTYYILSPSYTEAGPPSLTKDPRTGLTKLMWKQGDSLICITAPHFTEITTIDDNYARQQRSYREWFLNAYPNNKITTVVTSPTPIPLPGG